MKIYNNYVKKSKDLIPFFPADVLCSNDKDGGYMTTNSFFALSNYKYIQYNSKERISVIAVDIDDHNDGAVWMDYDLPQPSWIIFTDRGIQLAWVLENPIFLTEENKERKRDVKYAKDVLNKLVYALDGDMNAIGFNRVFRNPLQNETHFSDTRVSLKDFDLPTPSQEWWNKLIARNKRKTVNDTLFDDIQSPEVITDFADMQEGDGRNEALFDRLRFWAYGEARYGRYNEFDLAHKGLVLNQQFKQPMSLRETERIITSIDYWMETEYNNRKGNYMAETTPEERSKRASMNGKKGAMAKQKEARTRILATLNQVESFGIKITARNLAERAKSDKNTVSAYLKELGYKEVSRKEGWKR